MALSKAEKVLISITVVFAAFVIGYFAGKNSVGAPLSVETGIQIESQSESPKQTTAIEAGAQNGQAVQTPAYLEAEQAKPSETEPSETGKININTADAHELATLPGIGEGLAQRIIEFRTANGPFEIIEEITDVSGVGDVTFEKIKDLITVD